MAGELPFGLAPSGALTAYTPTLRERVSDWLRPMLFTDDRAGQEKANRLTNWGETMLPPFGFATQFYDTGRAAGSGDYLTAGTLGAMAVLPGGSKKGIRAYHGSPHSFDKFSMDKIGTGEGAQAYGHGLYFAESEGVARSYKDQLKKGDNNSVVHIGDREFPSDMGNYYIRQATERVAPPETTNFASGKETYDFYNKELGDAAYKALKKADPSQDPVAVMSAAMDEKIAKLSPYDDELPSILAMKNATLEYAKNNIKLAPNGSMYEVNIDADPNVDFINFDAPWSEQPQKVKDAFYYLSKNQPDGSDLARRIEAPVFAQEASDRGVKGIQFLDAGSRNNDGWKIMGPSETVSGKYVVSQFGGNNAAKFDTKEAAEKFLAQKQSELSRNYVVFDDKLVSIVKKYGIAGASAMLGYNLLDGLSEAQAAELKTYDGGR